MNAKIKAKRKYSFNPDYAVAPGETLVEVLESLSMTQKEFAKRIGLTEQTIIRIIKGTQPITYETANRLEMVTGIAAQFWNNLELQYQQQLSKIKQIEELRKNEDWLTDIPTGELISRGMIDEPVTKAEMVGEALSFYGVANVDAWKDIWLDPRVAAKRSDCFETNIGAASAWIRIGELQAQEIDCATYNAESFQNALEQIRTLTREEPQIFIPEMQSMCAQSGVALSLVKEFKKVPWNGASKWLSPTKAMILLNLRGKSEDLFWFSFFHEAYHILHGEKKRLYIAEDKSQDIQEKKADSFAANMLLPEQYNAIVANLVSKQEILDLAEQLSVSPGIIAGRFRHLTGKWSFFNNLTRTFVWDDELVG